MILVSVASAVGLGVIVCTIIVLSCCIFFLLKKPELPKKEVNEVFSKYLHVCLE